MPPCTIVSNVRVSFCLFSVGETVCHSRPDHLGTQHVSQDGLRFVLPQHSECWRYRHSVRVSVSVGTLREVINVQLQCITMPLQPFWVFKIQKTNTFVPVSNPDNYVSSLSIKWHGFSIYFSVLLYYFFYCHYRTQAFFFSRQALYH